VAVAVDPGAEASKVARSRRVEYSGKVSGSICHARVDNEDVDTRSGRIRVRVSRVGGCGCLVECGKSPCGTRSCCLNRDNRVGNNLCLGILRLNRCHLGRRQRDGDAVNRARINVVGGLAQLVQVRHERRNLAVGHADDVVNLTCGHGGKGRSTRKHGYGSDNTYGGTHQHSFVHGNSQSCVPVWNCQETSNKRPVFIRSFGACEAPVCSLRVCHGGRSAGLR
jgi:hypothetical protein